MTRAEPYVLPFAGQLRDLNGLALKAGAAHTDGALAVWEGGIPPHTSGPPLHVHANEDEALYVLEGEVTIRTGDATTTAAAGSFVWLPREVPHTFANLSDSPLRMLGFAVPGGIEDLLAAVPRDASAADPGLLAELAAKFGSRVIGPPMDVLA